MARKKHVWSCLQVFAASFSVQVCSWFPHFANAHESMGQKKQWNLWMYRHFPMIFPCFDGPHVCPVATFLLIRWRTPGHFHSSAPGGPRPQDPLPRMMGYDLIKKLEHHWLYLVISLLTSYNWELTSYNQLLTGYIWLQLVVTAYFMGYGINISPDHWYILCINTDEWFQTMFVIGDHHAKCLKSAINQRKTKDYGMSPRQFALRSVATSDVAVLIGRRQG